MAEAWQMLRQGLAPGQSTPTSAVGYKQAMQFLVDQSQWLSHPHPHPQHSSMSLDDWAGFEAFVRDFQRQTRRLAQDQLTWFRNEPLYKWIPVDTDGDADGIADDVRDGVVAQVLHEAMSCTGNGPAAVFDNRGMGYLSKPEEKRLRGYTSRLDLVNAPGNPEKIIQTINSLVTKRDVL
mmetsp:Transcript_14020/g.35398  ORF Transcript_14020/g.35398 Transcript_14020/m.35398 type:complete len:179 (+) Transcript_14020:3-539(+)